MAYYGKAAGGLNADWVDIVTLLPAISGKVVLIQSRADSEPTFVVFGGAKPLNLDDGFELEQNDVIWGSGTAIWVRAGTGNGFIVAVMDKE